MSYFEPALPLLILAGFIATVRAWRQSTKGKRPLLLTFTVVGMLLVSLNFTAWLFSRPLEMWYSQDPRIQASDAQAIVVLAGSVRRPEPSSPYPLAAQDTYIRLQHAVWLFKNWKPLPILATGGGVDEESYAQVMRQTLEAEGIPADEIWIECSSRSTYENAKFGSEVLRQHGVNSVVLVVEASSMPRAAASFRKFGLRVTPAPARFTSLEYDFSDLIPNWRAIALNSETLHEMVGLVWYKVRRRI